MKKMNGYGGTYGILALGPKILLRMILNLCNNKSSVRPPLPTQRHLHPRHKLYQAASALLSWIA